MIEWVALLAQHNKHVADVCRTTMRRLWLAGHTVPVANVPGYMASDAGHLLSENEPFGRRNTTPQTSATSACAAAPMGKTSALSLGHTAVRAQASLPASAYRAATCLHLCEGEPTWKN